jgi:hypothetical protein
MHRVVFEHMNPMRGVELKNQLVADGLKHHTDFEWAYHSATYDNDGYSAVTPKSVTFDFQDAATATFYKLKWS